MTKKNNESPSLSNHDKEQIDAIIDEKTSESGLSRRDFLLRRGGLAAVAAAFVATSTKTVRADTSGGCDGSLLPAGLVPDPMPNCQDLSGKVVVISGGTRGLGKATAEAFVDKGATVVGASRTPQRFAPGNGYEILRLDVRIDGSVRSFVRRVADQHGRIDIVINNAAIASIGRTLAASGDQLLEIFNTNVAGAHRFTTACLPYMGLDPRVITISSLADTLFSFYENPYAMTKRALTYWNSLVDVETYPLGGPRPKFTVLSPGDINTTFGLNSRETGFDNNIEMEGIADADFETQIMTHYARVIALANGMDPEFVADAVTRIACSPDPKKEYTIWDPCETIAPLDITGVEAYLSACMAPKDEFIAQFRLVVEYISDLLSS